MATEIEKKYRLREGEKALVLAALEELGAAFAGADFEENILFLGGDLAERGAVLRLRRIGARTILTYKRKIKADAGGKHYVEHETAVEDFDEAAAIFENLGYRRSLVYEKRRRTWRFRAVEVVVDELPFGDFMEIEGAVTAIAEAELLLGADEFEAEPLTYPQLTLRHGARRGALTEARFAAAAGDEKRDQ